MSLIDPTIGEITLFGGSFAPRFWANCDGQLLPIAQNTALFSILGTTYGGDGRTTFALPDFRSRVPVHIGSGPGLSNVAQGQRGGSETNILNVQQIPAHNHGVRVSSANGTTATPAGGESIAKTVENQGRSANEIDSFNTATPDVTLNAGSTTNTGANQPVNNRQPFIGMRYIIALQGTFPSRN